MVRSSTELANMFFEDLKAYNSRNFQALIHADLTIYDPASLKAFASVITRYFIFCEKHPEVSQQEAKVLFFHLNLDLIAKYFSEYPDMDHSEELQAFQTKLIQYAREVRVSLSGGVDHAAAG